MTPIATIGAAPVQITPATMMRPEALAPEPQAPSRSFGGEFMGRVNEARQTEAAAKAEDPVMRMFDRTGLRQGYERYLETSDRAAWCDRIGDTAGANRARSEGQMQLLAMQMGVQDHHMKVELASKVVEHGSSSTKTVLQTQM